MKRVYMICLTIMSCILFSGCGYIVMGIEHNKRVNLAKAERQSALNCANTTMACYQLSGASETKFIFTRYNLDDSDICRRNKFYDNEFYGARMKIARQKATKNGTLEQIEQCLKSIDKIIAKENECKKDDIDCYNEASESYLAHQKSLEPKLKNVKFSCSREDEMMEKYGPKFDKDIKQYALDLIKFKPIVSKDIMEDIDMANLTKELKQYDIDSDIIQSTLDSLKNNSVCMYKMKYYVGDLNNLDGFKKSGTLASKISKGYDDFIQKIKSILIKQKIEKNPLPNIVIIQINSYDSSLVFFEYVESINDKLTQINKKIKDTTNMKMSSKSSLLVEKHENEAMLKFLEEK